MQKDKGRIIFYPMKFIPNEKQLDELDRLQAEINYTHNLIAVEEKFDQYNIMLRKQALANKLRSLLQVVK